MSFEDFRFHTFKIEKAYFRELSVNAKDHTELYIKLKAAVVDAKWRVDLLQALIGRTSSILVADVRCYFPRFFLTIFTPLHR